MPCLMGEDRPEFLGGDKSYKRGGDKDALSQYAVRHGDRPLVTDDPAAYIVIALVQYFFLFNISSRSDPSCQHTYTVPFPERQADQSEENAAPEYRNE